MIVPSREPVSFSGRTCTALAADFPWSGQTLGRVLDTCRTKHLLVIPRPGEITPGPRALERLCDAMESSGAGIAYSDSFDRAGTALALHPRNDCQPGSVRDDFDFGSLMVFSTAAARRALRRHGAIPEVKSAGLYDLRLKVSIDAPLLHLQEPLYTAAAETPRAAERIFDYVDRRNEARQSEMESVFTAYLKSIGAYLEPRFEEPPKPRNPFPVEASVVIPVRNRKGTIAGAVASALSQKTDFLFNVIVVDNFSTDGTTALLSGLAARHGALKHVVPSRADLGIGGCWNEAVGSAACGRFAVQLDSDDLYSGSDSLQRMVDTLRGGGCAMVIGSYRLVNDRLEDIPPGLVDHREWTDDNGRNNALRVNGLGAPRGYDTALMREIGFLNVSYGEDYAAALRVCRQYRIGRIYDSLYLCRRWRGNTDAALAIEAANRNDAFKDRIRTLEIRARQKWNRKK